jgi:hypothetical protein
VTPRTCGAGTGFWDDGPRSGHVAGEYHLRYRTFLYGTARVRITARTAGLGCMASSPAKEKSFDGTGSSIAVLSTSGRELRASGGRRHRFRDLHARLRGAGRDMECGGRAHPGLAQGGDPGTALLGLLHPGGHRGRKAREGSPGRPGDGSTRSRLSGSARTARPSWPMPPSLPYGTIRPSFGVT